MSPIRTSLFHSSVPTLSHTGATTVTVPPITQSTAAPNSRPTTVTQHTPTLSQYVTMFRQGLSELTAISQYAAEQRIRDRTQGIGLLTGAQQTGAAIRYGAELTSTITPPQELFAEVGKLGQEYSLDVIGSSALLHAAKQLGVDISKVGTKELYTSVSNWLLGARAASTVGGTSVAAGTELATAVTGATTPISSILGGTLGFAGAAYSAYGLISNFGKSDPVTGAIQGAATGAYIGSVVPGIGTLIGGAIGAIAGGLLGCIKTGKHKDQLARDGVRNFLQERGIINSDHQVLLANGAMYDIGKDGGYTLQNVDGTTRHAYDVDFKNPLASQVVGWIQPLVSLLTGGNKKLKDDFTGYFTNAALSNATNIESARANVLKLYQQSQATPQILFEGISALSQQRLASIQDANAYLGGLQDLFKNTINKETKSIASVS